MRNMNAMMSTGNAELATPQDFFDKWNAKYHFDLDVCATPDNAKCATYFTKAQDGLKQEWRGKCWTNPPYGREISAWVKKAYDTAAGAAGGGGTVVCLPFLHGQTHLGGMITA